MFPGNHQARDMRDIRQQQGSDLTGNLPESGKIDAARIRAGSHCDHLGPMLAGHACQLIVINALILLAHTVVNDLKKLSGEIGLVAMGQMPPVTQIHGQHLVARLKEGKVDRHVRATAGMRLHIRVLSAKQSLGSVDGKALHLIDILTPLRG